MTNTNLPELPAQDLTERLREMSRRGYWPLLGDEAADEIERLHAALSAQSGQGDVFGYLSPQHDAGGNYSFETYYMHGAVCQPGWFPVYTRPQPAQPARVVEGAYLRCTHLLHEQGKPYPRTCQECGMGPCKRAASSASVINAQAVALSTPTAAPIHDPAVTTPREVLVGESPVDRIAAPAQEQPLDDYEILLINTNHGLVKAYAEAMESLKLVVAERDALKQQQAGAASASLLADALRKLLARTSGEHYPVEQELARTALSSHDDAFRQECDDADELLRMLGLDPESCRTDGGFINIPRVRSLLKDREPYAALSELLECFDLPYPPETAGRVAQSAWGDRRAAAKEQARAVLALKSAGVA